MPPKECLTCKPGNNDAHHQSAVHDTGCEESYLLVDGELRADIATRRSQYRLPQRDCLVVDAALLTDVSMSRGALSACMKLNNGRVSACTQVSDGLLH